MDILDLIDAYPQFISHIIINNIVPFNKLIKLAQTCTKFNRYFHKINAYSLLCKYNTGGFNDGIFKNPYNFYVNQHEKQLFQKIYRYQKNKIQLADATTKEQIVIIEYYYDSHSLEFHYTNWFIDMASLFGCVNVIDWFYNHQTIKFEYSKDVIDWASEYGHINVLNWFYNCSQTSKTASRNRKIKFEYSEYAIDRASRYGRIDVLKWFYNHAFEGKELEFKYTEYAINEASDSGHISVHEWFYNHSTFNNGNLKFKFTESAIKYALAKGRTHILEWFKNHPELKYTS